MSFAIMDEKEAKSYKPIIVYLDEENKIISEENSAEENDEC
jgi:aspartate 1-decarboxylase